MICKCHSLGSSWAELKQIASLRLLLLLFSFTSTTATFNTQFANSTLNKLYRICIHKTQNLYLGPLHSTDYMKLTIYIQHNLHLLHTKEFNSSWKE